MEFRDQLQLIHSYLKSLHCWVWSDQNRNLNCDDCFNNNNNNNKKKMKGLLRKKLCSWKRLLENI